MTAPATATSAASDADPAAPVLDRCRELVEDLSLAEVRRWKERHPGALAIGYMPIYVPRPLLEAIGCLPVAVFGGGDQVEIIRGDSIFQSYICHIPRSTVELGLRGHLDALDGMLFPSICDVVRNLSGVWKLMFPDRYSGYVDLPQNFDPELGGRFYVQEMRRIVRELVELGARPLEVDALRSAIRDENLRREALQRLDDLRCAEPWRLPASEAYLAARAGAALTAAEHTELIDELIAAVAGRAVRVRDNVRVIVRGSFCEQPPLALILTLEKSGCYIVDDDYQLGLRTIDGAIECGTDDDPLEALARAFLERGTATASRYIDEQAKGGALVERVRGAQADGVIFAAASFCDPALLDQPMMESALEHAGIPFTHFKFAENTGQFQVIREQAGAFSDSVKLWGTTQ